MYVSLNTFQSFFQWTFAHMIQKYRKENKAEKFYPHL